ncbi:hypothetical protein [Agromyces salentinus]|uniref:Uncharacterized protein n=1 Tax=Agromyces salentinus TaxID=269421 RepID=A0ABP4ZD05_9MICO|nr:hypothetical protein [Agromyces salentinus]
MDVSALVAVGSLIVAALSLGVTSFLAVLNRRAQIADRQAQVAEAHQTRLWEQKVPTIIEYLIWLERHADDKSLESYPAPDVDLYVRVTTFGPKDVATAIATARLAFARLRDASAGYRSGGGDAQSVQDASEAAKWELDKLRTMLKNELVLLAPFAAAANRSLVRLRPKD